MTSDDTDPASSPGPANGAADQSPDLLHLISRRGLDVPDEDRVPLAEYWAHIQQLRAAVDEQLLADSEIAVTWSAAEARRAP